MTWLRVHNDCTPPAFPQQLATTRNAEPGVTVYQGYDPSMQAVYVGITNDVVRRQYQHGTLFSIREMVECAVLTRGAARAAEQAMIIRNPHFMNKRNEISPGHPYYGEAGAWVNGGLERTALNNE